MLKLRYIVVVGLISACAKDASPTCAGDNAGLTLPAGFCAQVVADSVGVARHIAVAPNGDLFIALRDTTAAAIALRDGDGDGVAEQRQRFGSRGGTGIAFFDNHIYASTDTAIVRWPWTDGSLVPSGTPETIVTELAVQRGHSAKPFTIASDGSLYVTIGAPSNACQQKDRDEGSKGQDPCPLLENSGGIWRFDARKPMQRHADGTRFATGLRNVVALTIGPDGSSLWAVQHGRDLLSGNWGKQHAVFTDQKSAENPAEELFLVEQGGDYGWPFCYYDNDLKKKVLAPEYGGDGTTEGRCATVKQPLVAFPGHWAPESIVFYTGTQLPVEYQGGAFVAFHGSWNRAPLPQAGFNVAFVPFANNRPSGTYQTFADGFRGDSTQQLHRPMGLAVTSEGHLIVGDDKGGRIYRIWYVNSQ
jgi:glucose/arabinose dehydrogenase